MANTTNDIQQCIQRCRQNAQQLENLANQATNVQLKSTLKEAAHHLDLCIEECQFSLDAVQTGTMS